ncbi:hypothetical protein C4G89_RS00150 [Vibrio parahaemolyticus]|nr:hypothetical protein [Vibrio parahaemolyticus]HDU8579363.1 hypothetical protein [Vibrio diabolicus]
MAARLGVSGKTLYKWVSKFSKPSAKRKQDDDLPAEVARFKRQLKRAEQERNILKEAARFFAHRATIV